MLNPIPSAEADDYHCAADVLGFLNKEVQSADEELQKTMLRACQDVLPAKLQTVLNLNYYDMFNLKDIADILHASESRVSQMHRDAINRLKSKMNKASISIEYVN